MKIGILIFLGAFGALTGVTAVLLTKIRYIARGEKRILFAVAASIPLLAIRFACTILAPFQTSSKTFSTMSTRIKAVVVQAFFSLAEEFAVVTVYIGAGLAAQSFLAAKSGQDTDLPTAVGKVVTYN